MIMLFTFRPNKASSWTSFNILKTCLSSKRTYVEKQMLEKAEEKKDKKKESLLILQS
jgi:hypothetical protein